MKQGKKTTWCDAMTGMCDIVQEDATFEQKGGGLFSRRPGPSGEGNSLFLENGVVFVVLPN